MIRASAYHLHPRGVVLSMLQLVSSTRATCA